MIALQHSAKISPSKEVQRAVLFQYGLDALGRLAEQWALSEDGRTRLLNGGAESASIAPESLERLSHLFGIYRAVTALFGHEKAGLLRWLRASNSAPPFAGSSPIDVILDGRNLGEVRGYLECQLVA